MTEPETVTLRRLYEAADLFDNGHIGAEWSASDLGVEMLIVRDDGRAVALMTFGNRTFAAGPRRALLDWLRQQQVELQAAVVSKE